MFREWLPARVQIKEFTLYDSVDHVHRTLAYSLSRDPISHGITILVLDDRSCNCFQAVPYERGEDQHIIRTVTKQLVANALIREVIVADFDKDILNALLDETITCTDINSLSGRRKIDLKAGRFYVLLDIYGQSTAPFGHEFFDYLTQKSAWKMMPSNIFAFSTGDSSYLLENGVKNGIDKPIGRANDDSYEKLLKETDNFVLRITNSHQSVFKKLIEPDGQKTKLGQDEECLLKTAKLLREKIHETERCHGVKQYLNHSNKEFCNEKITSILDDPLVMSLKQALGQSLHEVAEKLFQPLAIRVETESGETKKSDKIGPDDDSGNASSGFVISKSLSCYGSDVNGEPDSRMPGYWLGLLTKMQTPHDIGALYTIVSPGQPLIGLLRAINQLVFMDEYIDTETTFLRAQSEIEVKLLFSDDGRLGLKALRSTLSGMFVQNIRPELPVGRNLTTAAFQALKDSGFKLRCAEFVGEKLKVKMYVELRNCP